MFATRCVREAAGVQGPASVFPVALSSVAQSVWTSATSTKGTKISVCVFVSSCQVNQNGPKLYGLWLNVFECDDGTELFEQGWPEQLQSQSINSKAFKSKFPLRQNITNVHEATACQWVQNALQCTSLDYGIELCVVFPSPLCQSHTFI